MISGVNFSITRTMLESARDVESLVKDIGWAHIEKLIEFLATSEVADDWDRIDFEVKTHSLSETANSEVK